MFHLVLVVLNHVSYLIFRKTCVPVDPSRGTSARVELQRARDLGDAKEQALF